VLAEMMVRSDADPLLMEEIFAMMDGHLAELRG
jgi:hypothetical protein